MGTAPAPTLEHVVKFYRVQLSSNLVHKAGFPWQGPRVASMGYKAFDMFTTHIFVCRYGLNLKTFLTFQVAHFGK